MLKTINVMKIFKWKSIFINALIFFACNIVIRIVFKFINKDLGIFEDVIVFVLSYIVCDLVNKVYKIYKR